MIKYKLSIEDFNFDDRAYQLYLEGIHPNYSTTIPKDKWGVHETHCCEKHGCKYGYNDCPVEIGLVKQMYECELGDEMNDPCYEDNTKLPEKLQKCVDNYVKHLKTLSTEEIDALLRDMII